MAPPRIPGVELEAELGRGVSSIVYRARLGDAPCAVKIPRSKGRWTKWVHREAVALARVRHPALPRVLEVGSVDGLPFLALELVEGETLAARLERGALPEAAAVGIAIDVADALAAVHAVGLVHRDVKPRNILLEPSERVRLVDFGFATGLERVAREGSSSGTPRYAAPEQKRAPSRLDARADLYALGLVLAEMLLGSLPEEATGPALEPALRRVASPGVVAVVQRLLEEKPEDRFAGAIELRDALRAERGMAPGARGVEGPDLGLRPSEVARLVRELRDVGKRGGSVVRLVAGRGMGKTRLLHATMQMAARARRATPIEVTCQDGDAPLALVRRLVDAAVAALQGALDGDEAATNEALRAAIRSSLHPFARLVAPALAARLAPTDAVLDPGTDAFAEVAAEIVGAVLRKITPALVCVDDVHWIDPLSRQVLAALADQIGSYPMLLVLAARPGGEALGIDPIVQAARSRSTAIELTSVDRPSIERLLEGYLHAPPPPELVPSVAALADGTPLGVLEVLEAYLDSGALRPHRGDWMFDTDAASAVALPRGATALLARRLAELAPATLRVLEAAAVHGRTWDEALLAELFGLTVDDIGFAANDARRARLVETGARGAVRFVHDAVRETLVDGLAEDARRELHQRCAEALDRRGTNDFETICAIANHYAHGVASRTPERAFWTFRIAADAALARAANETAIGFLTHARAFATTGGLTLDARFFESLGEAYLRTGELDASRAAFHDALERGGDGRSRARLYGRVAWVEQARSDADASWSALASAFEHLGEQMPVESVGSAIDTLRAVAQTELHRKPRRAHSPADAELLCALHYQNVRLAVEYGRPARALQSMVAALAVSEPLGDSPSRARARATEGLMLTVLGRREAGRRAADDAFRIARALSDPKLTAFCMVARATALAIAGDLDDGVKALEDCLDQHGHWIELNEYCMTAGNGDVVESMRGRARHALRFAEHALERARRRRRVDGALPLMVHRLQAVLAALGRKPEEDPWLDDALRQLEQRNWRKGYIGILSFVPRIRYLFETGETGPAFESLVAELRREERSHRSVPALVEAYLYIVHARVHASLRAPRSERARHAALVRDACRDLAKRARQPVLVAHVRFAEGHAAWLAGKREAALRLLAEADAMAIDLGIPWVQYAVARTRAHDLSEREATSAAIEQARIAEAIARAHGALPKARWIVEELGLAPADEGGAEQAMSSRSSESGRQLRSLVALARTPRRAASLSEQAVVVAEEVTRVMKADKCLLLFRPEGRSGDLVVAVDAQVGRLEPSEEERAVLERAMRSTGAQIEVVDTPGRGPSHRRLLTAPLSLFEHVVGAVCVELGPETKAADRNATAVLLALASQVPVALELARLLGEREQLQASLLQAQRMEAVGQLAGGIAHDFNNMLSAILASADALSELPPGDPEAAEEIEVIRDAARRAAELTKRLLSFSRHKPLPLERVDTKALLTGLVPMIKRIVGERVQIRLELAAEHHAVRSDPTALEQAIVNLATNARDAMKRRGTLTLRTREVDLDADAVRRGAPAPGHYVAIDVTDSGEGMSREVLERIFDPFFSTKPTGAGTGLGLTMVYTFMKRSSGHIEVTSTPGAGTTFTLFFPCDTPASIAPPALRPARPTRAEGTKAGVVLVVDDDRPVRASIMRTLRREGYEVIGADGAEEAISIMQERGGSIALVILDVLMPGLTGPALERKWNAELEKPPKVLFVSGFSPETLPTPDAGHVRQSTFLQKPFSNAELVARVERLIAEERRAAV